jgi:hypothetical protein
MPCILMPLLALLLAATAAAAGEPNPNIRFGLPALAKADPETSREAFLIARPQFVLSYNAKTRTPNWISWRLLELDIGSAPRFAFEPTRARRPGTIAPVTANDNNRSGPERGDMCPAKVRSITLEYSLDNLLRTVPAEDRPKFDKLRKALQEQLSGVKVFKVGDKAERTVYIVGKTKDGKWAGLKTTVVET